MKKTLLKILISFIILFSIIKCNTPVNSHEDKSENYQWVFISIESVTKEDISDYFYFGQVKENVLDNINKNNTSGYFTIKNVRFLNDSDKLEVYADSTFIGEMIFRIKDIAKVDLLNKDPILTYKYDELAENSKKLYNTIEQK